MNTSKTFIRVGFLCLIAALLLATPQRASAQVVFGVAVMIAPPDLPVYDQPLCPGQDYFWVPGYWAWDPGFDDYYWVPGTWVLAPEPGFFWTPGYWAWVDDAYYFQPGYWGPVVGFYGGVVYGFGYFGHGYDGGRWERGHFFYNTAVTNVNVTVIHNTYVDRTVIVNRNEAPRVSYNGPGGVNARPTPEQEAAARERHSGPVKAQTRNRDAARSNRDLRASVNHGRPPIAATPKPATFKGNGIVPAREGGAVHTRETSGAANARENGRPAVHPNELPPPRPAPPHTGNSKQDQKYEKQQQKLAAQQEKERQKLQQQQNKEHARMEKQRASEQQRQQMEQRHQQQTQQMQQRQEQRRQQTQRREEPPARPPSSRPPERPPL
jgi:hypothetical protein